MRNLLSALALALGVLASSSAMADGAIICTSDSKGACQGKQYCCYSGGESEGDKFCKSLGCRRGGTSSCPTAANVKSCGTRNVSVQPKTPPQVQIAWCVEPSSSSDQG